MFRLENKPFSILIKSLFAMDSYKTIDGVTSVKA